jgi:hypothetical protein
MIDDDLVARTRPITLEELIARVRAGSLGLDPASVTVASAFLTLHSTRHVGRNQRYHN